MLVIENVSIPDGIKLCYPVSSSGNDLKSVTVPSSSSEYIDASGLTLLPALIDPHVHFRTPGAEHKENWISGSRAAIAGGLTTVFDMPNNSPSCSTYDRLMQKKAQIEQQLKQANIPLRYYLYFGASRGHLSEISRVKNEVVGIKVFMGSSTGDLLVDDEASLKEIFQRSAEADLPVALHAEDESIINKNKQLYSHCHDPHVHSMIRSREAAKKAVETAINLSEPYDTRLCILHVSTRDEVLLIKEAKRKGRQVYGEVSPHHLLLSSNDYSHLGNCALVNPPLREKEDCDTLWEALRDGTLDYIGSDHAPHLLSEKRQPYGRSPSGFPGIELMLPLILTAASEKQLTLKRLIEAMRLRIEAIFQLAQHDDFILINLEEERVVHPDALNSRCGWTPYAGRKLKGWPHYTCLKGRLFKTNRLVPCYQA